MDGVWVLIAGGVLDCVAVGRGEEVTMKVCVAVAVGGTGVEVGTVVFVGVCVVVDVGKFGRMVMPGVSVGLFGTHNLWPE